MQSPRGRMKEEKRKEGRMRTCLRLVQKGLRHTGMGFLVVARQDGPTVGRPMAAPQIKQ